MKKILTTFLMAVAAIGANAQSLINVSDQSIADWDKLPTQYVTSATCATNAEYIGLKSAKIYADQTYLNLLLEIDATVLSENSMIPVDIMIDVDNSTSTGGNPTSYWTDMYCDIIIEGYLKLNGNVINFNPSVYKWSGEVGSNDWNFSEFIENYDNSSSITPINNVAIGNSQKVGDYFEIQLDRTSIPVAWDSKKMNVGLFIANEYWSEVGYLPNADMIEGETVPVSLLSVSINPTNGYRTTTIDNITYGLHYPDAFVVAGESQYSGKVVIPATVINNDSTYNVTRIDANAFENCSALTMVTIPSSVTTIGSKAFYNCYNLQAIICKGTTPPSCGTNCFYNVPSTIAIYVPQGSEYSYQSTSPWSNFTKYNPDACGDDLRWTYTDGILLISGEGDMYDYSTYWYSKDSSYSTAPWHIYAESISQIIISDNVTSIGAYAFHGLKNLQSVTIGKNVKRIGKYAFEYCVNLPSVTIPNNVKIIGNNAFERCSNLENLVLGTGVDSIYSSAFYRCEKLTSVTIPQNVRLVERYAFEDCTGLKTFIMKNPQTVCENAFVLGGCSNLETVSGPASLFNYPDGYKIEAAYLPYTTSSITITGGELEETGCMTITNNYKYLKSLDVAATSNKTLSDEAFMNCYNLESLKLPAQIEDIPYMAIAGCVNLKSVVIPASVVEIDQRAFEDCRSLSSITFAGTNVQRIGNWAFYNAHQLTSLTLPQGISEIGDAAFYGCTYIKDLQVPTSVRKLGDNCFAMCSKLEGITVTAAAPPAIQSKTFYDVDRAIPVYVPAKSLQAYKNADQWKDFSNIRTIAAEEQEMDEDDVVIEPEVNQVVVTWPKTDEAATYKLILYQNDEVVCTLIFNNLGQLQTIAYAAPARGLSNNATYANDMISGYKFAIDGLMEDTEYSFIVTAADAQGETIPTYCYSSEFRTKSTTITALQNIRSIQNTNKVIMNGQMYILRDGKMFNAVGGKLR